MRLLFLGRGSQACRPVSYACPLTIKAAMLLDPVARCLLHLSIHTFTPPSSFRYWWLPRDRRPLCASFRPLMVVHTLVGTRFQCLPQLRAACAFALLALGDVRRHCVFSRACRRGQASVLTRRWLVHAVLLFGALGMRSLGHNSRVTHACH